MAAAHQDIRVMPTATPMGQTEKTVCFSGIGDEHGR